MNQKEQLEAIQDIRQLMNKSVRFLSLSGLAGIVAGVLALCAGTIALERINWNIEYHFYTLSDSIYFFYVGTATLIITLIISYLLTAKQAKKQGVKIWDETGKKAFVNLAIPLVTGGIFCLAMMKFGLFGLLAPCTLIFYGLALINVSKYTYPQIFQLGLFQIVLGLTNLFFIGYGILFWMIGFGLLHLIYGTYMYNKYDR